MQAIGDLISKKTTKKAPAYEWQDFALRIIAELNIPPFKKNSVFKVCKELDKNFIEKCVDETKELATGTEKWKYFFKLVGQSNTRKRS